MEQQATSCFERVQVGLTPAEARLAAMLAAGEDLRTAAEIHCMAYETARRHLKAIFYKAEVNSQSKLVALLTRLSVGRSATPQQNPERNGQH